MSFFWINNSVEEEDKGRRQDDKARTMEKWRKGRGEKKKTKD